MKSSMVMDIFKPEYFSWCADENGIDIYSLYGKEWKYASKGRYALFHILSSLKVKRRILMPVYACDSILVPLRLLGIKPVFYDVCINDLNADIESIEYFGKRYDTEAVLVASMYGMPANLSEIEKLCRSNSWLMIDDAAQSLGAHIDGRMVGTFGDAGFFSFSPGKPCAGPMGAFFWTTGDVDEKLGSTSHDWYHKIVYKNFYYNRVRIYDDVFVGKRILYKQLERVCSHFLDIENDMIAPFEYDALSAVASKSLNEIYNYRKRQLSKLVNGLFIKGASIVGLDKKQMSNYHKFVLLMENKEEAGNLIQYLRDNKIYSSNGYSLLTKNLEMLDGAKRIDKCVVEIPMECDEGKMSYLRDKLNGYRNGIEI